MVSFQIPIFATINDELKTKYDYEDIKDLEHDDAHCNVTALYDSLWK